MDAIVYIFYGFYWVFCVIRAIMTGSIEDDAQYGAFNDADGLFLGFFGSIVWLIGLIILMCISVVPMALLIESEIKK